MIWGAMVQLGHNMWGELPLDGDAPKAGREHMFAHDFNRTDVDMWNDVTEYYARKGANLVLIDLGEGLQYPSHPELAVKGSWSPARRKEGREPVVVTPDAKPPEGMPYFDFMVRDALIDIRWGETLAENGVSTDGDVTTVRLKSGKAIRCATFRSLA